MIQIKNIESIDKLSELKQQYMDQRTAPLDGMWLFGFVPAASHFGFYQNDSLIGFCCVNDEGYLLQFYLYPECHDQASFVFDLVLTQQDSPFGKLNGAFVSTAEPQYLSFCLDSFSTFTVHTLMYQLIHNSKSAQEYDPKFELALVTSEQLTEVVDFAKSNVGAPEEWLRMYYTNLINRQEVLGYWQNGTLLATGECRGCDQYQTDYADLGVIVDESGRGKGLATDVLKQLITICKSKELKPILSTEKGNLAAKKAISRAGFFAGNRLIQFEI